MRINKFVALATGLSRRSADHAIQQGRVTITGQPAATGQAVTDTDAVFIDGRRLHLPTHNTTIILHKPVGYVVSRAGQGAPTVYDLLPPALQALKPVGRLDKDSSGLLVLTSDGDLANRLTHPKFNKQKMYEVRLNKPLTVPHQQHISEKGIPLEDGLSAFKLTPLSDDATTWQITMHEGRNRQIRRTFSMLGYTVKRLHRTQFGDYKLNDLPPGAFIEPA